MEPIFEFVLDPDPREAHERAMQFIISHPRMAAMYPVTTRAATKLNDRTIHISSEGFGAEDPHTLILVCSPTYPDHWLLYSICPRSPGGTTSYKIKADEANAIRVANVILDIALKAIEPEEWMNDRGDDDEEDDDD